MIKKKKKTDITELLPGIQKNVWLKDYTTFKIGGRAKYFFVAKTIKDLILAIKTAERINLPFFMLGRGSNLLVSDKGYRGLVIKIENKKHKIINNKIIGEAGFKLSDLVGLSLKKRLTGLEWMAGIPGTVGGAIRGNAGAFGSSFSDNIQTVKVYDVKNKKIKILKDKNCQFAYRESIFKRNKGLVILSLTLKLKKAKRKEIENKIREYLNYRIKHQPMRLPSAGSIFANPKRFSAGELIEKCGLKGKKIGKAQISKNHANFIVNLGGAKAKDVKKLINLMKEKVKQKFGIILKEEIEYLS